MSRLVVVDGSNIATEGRTMPSLKQLNEAVLSFMEENPGDKISVVVDATFGHRIDPKEVDEFNEAVENNEIVAPPAGAVGRGDGFVLAIADKKNATILSNDSYQEFHGQYDWLFDEGRLIGGKPVPNIGWVFINRVPVRGPKSRQAVKDAKRKRGDSRPTKASKEANQPMPVPKAPPPGATLGDRKGGRRRGRGGDKETTPALVPSAPAGAAPAQQTNDLLSFLGFVEHHPVGSSVSGTVVSYSSHGAYVTVGDVYGYVPMRLMSDPPPRSAREMIGMGETVDLVVAGFNPGRRGIDLAMPAMAGAPAAAPTSGASKRGGAKKAAGDTAAPAKKTTAKKATAKKGASKAPTATKAVVAKKTAAKKTAAKKDAAPATKVAAKKAAAPAKATVAKKAAPAKKAAAPAKKAPAKKAAAKTATPAKKAAAPAKKAAAPAKKAAAPAKKAAAKKAAPAARRGRN